MRRKMFLGCWMLLIGLSGCARSQITLLKDTDVYYKENGDVCFSKVAFDRLLKRLEP